MEAWQKTKRLWFFSLAPFPYKRDGWMDTHANIIAGSRASSTPNSSNSGRLITISHQWKIFFSLWDYESLTPKKNNYVCCCLTKLLSPLVLSTSLRVLVENEPKRSSRVRAELVCFPPPSSTSSVLPSIFVDPSLAAGFNVSKLRSSNSAGLLSPLWMRKGRRKREIIDRSTFMF